MSDDRSQDFGGQNSGDQNPGGQHPGNQDPGAGGAGQPSPSLDKGAERPDPTYGYGPPTYGDPTAPSSSSAADPSAPSYGGGDQQPSYGGGDQQPSYGGGDQQPSYGGGDQQPSYGGGDQQPSYGAYTPPPSYGDQSGSGGGSGAPSYDPNAYAAAGAAAGGAYGAGSYGAPGSGGYGPPPKKKSKTGLVIGLVAGGLVVVIGLVVGVVAIASAGGGDKPSATVQAYLEALSQGNAEKALEQGEKPPDTTFATGAALKLQQDAAKISAIEVEDGYTSGNSASVTATYKFGDKQADERFSLTKIGGDWKLDDVVYPIDLSSLDDVPGLTLLGIEAGGKEKAYVFPGPLTWGSSNEYLTVTESDADDFTLSPRDGSFSFSTLETGLSDAGEKAVAEAVSTYISTCAKSKELEPDNCSQYEYDYDFVDGTATWTAPTDLSKLEYRTSSPVTEVYVSGELTWSVSYTTKDYTGKTATKKVDDVDGSLYGKVDLSKSPPVYSE